MSRGLGAHRPQRPGAGRWLLGAALTLLLQAPVHAERADRARETQIEADHQVLDDLNQVSVLTGHVILTRGTIRLTGDRMEYREDADGYQYAVVTAAPDTLATVRERRDASRPGVEETVDGVAERIEYDGKADTIRLVRRAVIRRYENGQQRDEFSGAQIFYDARNSRYDLNGAHDPATGDRRVHVLIAPRAPAEPPPAPARLEPDRAGGAGGATGSP